MNQKFPNRDEDKNGQSDAIADDTGFADFSLFHHAILLFTPNGCGDRALLRLQPRGLVAGDFSPACFFRSVFCRHHVFSCLVAR